MVVADEPQSLRTLREDIPEELRAVVLKCLEKQRDGRFGSVAELVMALTPFASRQGASAAQSIVGSHNSLAATSAASIPAERASFRTGGGSTSVAWDKTQLAAAAAPNRSKAPFVVAAIAVFGALAATAFFVLHRPAASPQAGTPSSATSGALLAATSAPQTPLASATGSPDRPVPQPSVGAAVTSARTGASHAATAAPRDAGATVSPPPTPAVTTTTTGHEELPSTRN